MTSTDKIKALPDGGEYNTFFLRHYNDFESIGLTVADLKALVASHERMEKALEFYAQIERDADALDEDETIAFGKGNTIAREALKGERGSPCGNPSCDDSDCREMEAGQ